MSPTSSTFLLFIHPEVKSGNIKSNTGPVQQGNLAVGAASKPALVTLAVSIMYRRYNARGFVPIDAIGTGYRSKFEPIDAKGRGNISMVR